MGGTIHCKMTRVGGVSLGHDRMYPEGSMQGSGMGVGGWAARGSTTGRAAKGEPECTRLRSWGKWSVILHWAEP